MKLKPPGPIKPPGLPKTSPVSPGKLMNEKMRNDAMKAHQAADRFSREGDQRRRERAMQEARRLKPR